MLGGRLLSAGISQAQDVGAQDVQAQRSAELAAASGGPASDAHLIAFAGDRAAVEAREDDVAAEAATSAPGVSSTQLPAPVAGQATPQHVATADMPTQGAPRR